MQVRLRNQTAYTAGSCSYNNETGVLRLDLRLNTASLMVRRVVA